MTIVRRRDIINYWGSGTSPNAAHATIDIGTQTTIGFSGTVGDTILPTPQTIVVNNTGTGSFSGVGVSSVTYVSGSGWLAVSMVSGVQATVLVQPTVGSLTQGTYQATFQITDANATNSPVTVTVNFTIASTPQAPIITIPGGALNFNGTAGGVDTADQTLLITNTGGGSFTGLAVGNLVYVSGSTGWLKPPTGGTFLTGQTVTAHAQMSGVSAGTSVATFDITASNATNSPVTATVTLTASGTTPAQISLTKTTQQFTAIAAGSNPAATTIAITNGGTSALAGPATGAASYSGTHSGWLTKSVTTVTAGTDYLLNLSVTTPGTAGTSTATFNVTDANATNSPVQVTVTFVVTSNTPPGNKPGPRFGIMQGSSSNATVDTQTGKIVWNPFTNNGLTDPDGDPTSASYYYDEGRIFTQTVATQANFLTTLNAAKASGNGAIVEYIPFTMTSRFTWPAKTDSGWILVRPVTKPTIGKGRRAKLSHMGSNQKISLQTPNNGFSQVMAANSQGWHLREVWFENEVTSTTGDSTGMFWWGYPDDALNSGNGQTNTTDMPKRLKIDRCVFNNPWVTNSNRYVRSALRLDGQYARCVDSSFTGICRNRTSDAQAIAGINGLGAFQFENCTIEGSTENFLFGAGDTQMGSAYTYNADIHFRRCDFSKRSAWMTAADVSGQLKNFCEFKSGVRCVVEDFYLANFSGSAQHNALVVKCAPYTAAEEAFLRTNDITFRRGYMTNVKGSIQVATGDLVNKGGVDTTRRPNTPVGRVEFRDIVHLNTYAGTNQSELRLEIGGFANSTHVMDNIVIDHCMLSDVNSMVDFTTTPIGQFFTNFRQTNNIHRKNIQFQAVRNEVGIASNIYTLNRTCGGAPGSGTTATWTFAKNAAVDTTSTAHLYNSSEGDLSQAPYSNLRYATEAALTALLDTTNSQHQSVLPSSTALYQAGTDNLDIGPDWDNLVDAFAARDSVA